MRQALLATAALCCALTVSKPAQANDVAAGRQKAQACAVCHHQLGQSVTPDRLPD